MSEELAIVLDGLRRTDAKLRDALGRPPRSLAPDRDHATTLETLARSLLKDDEDPDLITVFGDGLARLALAQLDAFPGNLFWDLDFAAAQVLRQARMRPAESAEVAGKLLVRLADLQRLYGRETAINFSYVHDFTYGFDWAKWVGREPDQDGSVGPFDLDFLVYMRKRAHELMQLIAKNDEKYPSLPDGQPRNPFPFSREPDAELRLFPELARRGLLPVETWRTDAIPDCSRSFYTLRADVARELGL